MTSRQKYKEMEKILHDNVILELNQNTEPEGVTEREHLCLFVCMCVHVYFIFIIHI